MTVPCNVLMQYHYMVGVDLHDALTPAPVNAMPHFVYGCLKAGQWGLTPATLANDVENKKVLSGGGGGLSFKVLGVGFATPTAGAVMSRGTDIGPLIPHIAPDALGPLYTLASASKSEFGSHSVKAAQGPVATACSKTFNWNLNCAGASTPPLPSGFVLATTTVVAGMTKGDFIAGLTAMFIDSMIQFALNKLFGGAFSTTGLKLAESILANVLGTLGETFTSGSPLGWSPSYTPAGTGFGGTVSTDVIQDKVQKQVDGYYNAPAVEQHPGAAPVPATP